MAMDGMDLDAMSPVLTQLANAVTELQTIITTTHNAYSTIETSWRGNDATQFHSQWPSFTTALTQAHNDLSTLHNTLQTNYTAQQNTSQS